MPGELHIGDHTYGTVIRRGYMNNIYIGKFCQIGEGCIIDGGFNHNDKNISTYPFHAWLEPNRWENNNICRGDVTIGNDVWIGEGAMIMSGVAIDDGAVIGARSIITKNVPTYHKVVGNNRVIGQRFTDDEISVLSSIKWWDWSIAQIEPAVHILHGGSVSDLYMYFLKNVK